MNKTTENSKKLLEDQHSDFCD